MPKTDTLTIQIDPELKQKIEQLLRDMGLTPAQAITLFYKQIESQHGLPFEIKAPNKETLQAIEDLENRRNVKVFNSVEEALKELDI